MAYQISGKLPVKDRMLITSGGGVMAYLFLRRAGYLGKTDRIIEVKRVYRGGIPFCSLDQRIEEKPELIIDDIISSGQTISTIIKEAQLTDLELICLLASSNIDKGGNIYRNRKGSTIEGVDRLYCAQLLNGLPNKCTRNQKPWILSMRYLITKAIDTDYESYLSKKFGKEGALKIKEEVSKMNREPIDYLRKDPIGFLKRYGG